MFRIQKGNAYSGQEQHGLISLNFYHLRGKSELLSRFTGWHSAVLPQAAALVFQSVETGKQLQPKYSEGQNLNHNGPC